MTALLGFRGPHGHGVWGCDSAGFGHTQLRVGDAPARDQPFGDSGVWITADARIDGQAELKRKLSARGITRAADDDDAALILQAYLAWGEDCVTHLIGDFAFAVWDEPQRKLFCARDHFGVKPFFYSANRGQLVFSNTLPAVLAFPGVDSRLDELAIADLLLFDMKQDAAATSFAAVRRLPPAHCLAFTPSGLTVRPYWALPYDSPLVYRDSNAYAEAFHEVLAIAVADRVRSSRVCVHMSGGLDSPAVAHRAMAHLKSQGRPYDLRAHTAVYDRLFADEERHYTGLVAEKLGIPVHFRTADDYGLFERYSEHRAYFSEPLNRPLAALEVDLARQAARESDMVLTGWDGDTILNESPRPYFRVLLKERRWARLLANAVGYAIEERKILPAGTLSRLFPWGSKAEGAQEDFPPWLAPDFEHRLRLRERAAQFTAIVPSAHPTRPYAFRILDYVMRLSNFFEFYDPGCSGSAVEFRHPMFDLRVIEFCLSVPPYPWCVKKHLLRRAMKGILPEAVRKRPKTGLAGFPHIEMLKRDASKWVDEFVPCPETTRFVDRSKIPKTRGDSDPNRSLMNLRPLSLDLWLRNSAHPYS
ncbi:MAG: asparagine synthase-related protein [Usitatibacter sp.]